MIVPIIGSVLLLVSSQLVTTYMNIKYGSPGSSDFSIAVDPPYGELSMVNNLLSVPVSVTNSHEFICPYIHTVHLEATPPKGVECRFDDNDKKPPFATFMRLWPVNRTTLKEHITVEGLGGDGKVRNTTYLLSVNQDVSSDFNPTSYVPKKFTPTTTYQLHL